MSSDPVYPLFLPPPEFLAKPMSGWRLDVAKRYLAWLQGQVVPRTDGLLAYLGMNELADPVPTLELAGSRAAPLLRLEGFSHQAKKAAQVGQRKLEIGYEGQFLTAVGSALAIDLGLLVARFLTDRSSINWGIGNGPGKYVWKNHPVLTSPGLIPFDPVGVSIANAHAVLRGTRSHRIWAEMYEHSVGLRASV